MTASMGTAPELSMTEQMFKLLEEGSSQDVQGKLNLSSCSPTASWCTYLNASRRAFVRVVRVCQSLSELTLQNRLVHCYWCGGFP